MNDEELNKEISDVLARLMVGVDEEGKPTGQVLLQNLKDWEMENITLAMVKLFKRLTKDHIDQSALLARQATEIMRLENERR